MVQIDRYLLIKFFIVFGLQPALCAMNGDEQTRLILQAIPLGMGSPTFIERILRDAGVPADQIAQQMHEVYVNGRPIVIPYASLAQALHRLRPERRIRNSGRQACVQSLRLQVKIKKRSD